MDFFFIRSKNSSIENTDKIAVSIETIKDTVTKESEAMEGSKTSNDASISDETGSQDIEIMIVNRAQSQDVEIKLTSDTSSDCTISNDQVEVTGQNKTDDKNTESEKRQDEQKEDKMDSDRATLAKETGDGDNLMDYRNNENKAPADSSEDSSSDSDDADDEGNAVDEENETTANKINKAFSKREDESPERERNIKLNRHGFEDIRTRGELLPEDLPPLEELTITVDETVEMTKVGHIKSIVGILVVIQTCENIPPLNEDTILFVEGRKVLGQVFEVFGPVQTPWYSVRFNDDGNIKNKGLEVGMPVFCAPKEESFTRYVFVDSLKKIKGSDASWENNNEPPPKYIDYSDDEAERAAKQKKKKKKANDTEGTEDKEQNGEAPNKRNRRQNEPTQRNNRGGGHQGYRPRNPFQGQNMNGPRYPQSNGYQNSRQNYHSGGPRWRPAQDTQRNSPSPAQRFGGPPRFNAPMNQPNGDNGQYNQGNMHQGNNMPRYGFNPRNGGGGNNPRQNFNGMGMNNNQPGVSNMVRTPTPTNTGGNFIQNNQVQNGQQFQSSAPFRCDIPPPTFNQAAPQNRFNQPQNINNQNFQNFNQAPCQPVGNQTSIQTQSAPANQFVPGNNTLFNQGAPNFNQFRMPSNSLPPNVQNNNQPFNTGNTQLQNQPPGSQFRPSMNSQFNNAPVFGQTQSQFTSVGPTGNQLNQSGMNNNFTGAQGNQFANIPQSNNIPQTNNQPSNQGPRAPMQIHSLNPRLESNVPQGSGVPSGSAGRGYEQIQMGNLKPYRPEIVNFNQRIPENMGQQAFSGNIVNSGSPQMMQNTGNNQQTQGNIQGSYNMGPYIRPSNMQQQNTGMGVSQPQTGQGVRPMLMDQRYIQNQHM